MSSRASNNSDGNANDDASATPKTSGSERRKAESSNTESGIRRSIAVKLVRHAESQNNEVYRDARRIHKGGTEDFDLAGWIRYVDERRSADPGLSAAGRVQAAKLAEYLGPHLRNQASRPVRFVVSPMRRTIESVLPTLAALNGSGATGGDGGGTKSCDVVVNGFYFESEGCHTREKVEPGMNGGEISRLFAPSGTEPSFTGFASGEERGWYAHGRGAETRHESEERAAKFYVWLVEYLDQQLREARAETGGADHAADVFDAGVALPEEAHEHHSDRFGSRFRRRRTAICVGHGDFMSLVLKRIVAGFGHMVENEGVPHRSAFVHMNTGITELEYFGNGRFLLMSSNQLPHLSDPGDMRYITGGSLKDGWSYLVPRDKLLLDAEVTVAFSDEVQGHVQEQTEALRSLYLSKRESSVSSEENDGDGELDDSSNELTIVVKRGLQVVGCASLNEKTGHLSDMVVRPSARRSRVGKSIIEAVKNHAKQADKMDKLVVQPNTADGRIFFEKMGFSLIESNAGIDDSDSSYASEIYRMECKL